MAKDFFQTIAAKAGFAGEYEPLIESEFTAIPSGAYAPGEDGVFRTVPTTAGRTIQLLQSSPVYIETFQTSDAILRMPSGTIADNDASDGRFYFLRNNSSATGSITIEKNDGILLNSISPGDLVIVIHGENDDWDISNSISGAISHPVHVSSGDPTVTDDINSGFNVGDHWFNSTTGQIFQASDVSAGAAVWERIDQPKTNIAAVDPAVGNDDTEDYEIGSTWVNTASAPPRVWTAVDVSTGAAEWIRHTNLKSNDDTVDPSSNDDTTQGYEIGSIWVNSVSKNTFIAIAVGAGVAIWKSTTESGGGQASNPGELLYGTLLDYPSSGNIGNGLIQYLRVKIEAGTVINEMRTYVTAGGTGAREIRMGIYSQANPTDSTDIPATQIAQTASVSTAGTNGTFVVEPFLGGDIIITATGFYWLAIVMNNTSLKIAVTSTLRADFVPKWIEITTGTTLPANVGTITNPAGAIGFVAAQEVLA